ncbi:MAG: hypothetical protein EA338_01490 [Roseinatronobacter sp.]|nr:MAG: hypothetical protein EA338_01490 [Roseinatronobacter sp.]
MKPADQLATFVQDGFRAGHSAQDLRAALAAAGWSEPEIDNALAGWADHGLRLPVPRPRPSVSAAEAATYALLFFALLSVTWNVVALAFWLVEIWVPEADGSTGYGTARSMRWSIAVLVVILPLFLWLQARTDRDARANPGQLRSPTRKKFGAVTVFLAALVLVADAIAVVFAFLNGDMTLQFLIKAAIVALVAGLVIAWFRSFLAEG